MGTKAVSVKLSTEEHERFAALAGKRDRSTHYLMREALLGFLEYAEWRNDFEEEAEAAWLDHQKTGEHLTLDDIKDWAAKGFGPLPPWRT